MTEAVPPPTSFEIRTYLDQDMRDIDLIDVARGHAVAYSTRCPGKETANEDAAAIIGCGSDAAVLVVADGLGGGAAGEKAAKIAIETMAHEVCSCDSAESLLRTAIIDGFEKANKAVMGLGIGASTTLAVVEISKNTVRPYHVGDSTIFIVGGRGKIKLQTIAHSPVGYGVEAGYISEAEAIHHEDLHIVSNVLGTPNMRIEMGPTIRCSKRDTIMVSSDGVTDNVHVEEIIDCIRKGPLTKSVKKLKSLVEDRMRGENEQQPSKPDDATCLIFRRF